ncbi:MAG: AAA family ATPase, partial [Bacteroidota bacterium]
MDLKEKMLQDILGQQNVRLSVDQEEALGLFMRFIREEEYRSAFLLTGSAGTGKTFLISIFTKLLRKSGYKVILLAPTGRAAKVISRSAKRAAFTIHHHIYSPLENSYGDISFARKPNKEPGRTVYVVDEASMIGDKSDGATPNGLLDDLLAYAYDNDGSRKL